MKKPFISVCIPTYNSSTHIRECLQSVLAQTFADFEVIISDDGSTDDTLAIIADYANKDSRIKIFDDQTALKNVNRCFELAEGEWIKFVFHDDLLRPDCLELMVRNIQPAIPIICSLREFILEEGIDDELRNFMSERVLTLDKLFPAVRAPKALAPEDMSRLAWRHLGKNFIGEASNVMLHKSVCARFGNWNGDLPVLGDLEFWLRVSTNTGMSYIPEKLSSFRVHKSSKTGNMTEETDFKNSRCEIMLLLCQFAFHPAYAHFRETIRKEQGRSQLTDLFSWWVRDVYRASQEGDPEQRKAWLDECVNKYPVIEQFSKRVMVHSALLTKLRNRSQESVINKNETVPYCRLQNN